MRRLGLLLLAGCGRAPAPDSGALEEPFVDSLAPDSMHLLLSSYPPLQQMGHTLLEVALDLEERWVYDADAGGAMGAWRLAGGETVYARSGISGDLSSSIDALDRAGALLWRYDHLFAAGLGFSHGVLATPAGDFIALDSVGGSLVSFDALGAELWTLEVGEGDQAGSPNGFSLLVGPEESLLAVSLLRRSESYGADQLVLYSLGERLEPPSERWRLALEVDGVRAWPHGPHFQADGSLTLCLSGHGRVLGLDTAGDQQWSLPPADALQPLAFPRDALFLDDGSLLLVDGEAELLRIAEPFGRFQVVGARAVPGIFAMHEIRCGDEPAIPCLGG